MYVLFQRAIFSITSVGLIASSLSAQSLQLDFVDKDTGEPVSCRVEPTAAPKRFPKTRSNLTSGSTILFEESAKLKPAPGKYEFTATRGIEFADIDAGFELDKNGQDQFDVVFLHTTKMNEFNWFSGDLASHIPESNLARWAAADAINLSVSLASQNGNQANEERTRNSNSDEPTNPQDNSKFSSVQRAFPLRASTSDSWIVLHPIRPNAEVPPEIENSSSLLECMQAVQSLPREDWMIELSGIEQRDVPILLAVLPIHTVQILSDHLQVNAPKSADIAFFNPDPKRFSEAKGLGRLIEYSYWQMLEAGFRIAPTAGSHFRADGKTHHGYNRVYTWIDLQQKRTPETWLRNCREGFIFITNGPLLRIQVNGGPPGALIKSNSGQSVYTDLSADLTVRDEVDYLDIIHNGTTKYQAKLEEHARRGKFPELEYNESGWMLIRVVTAHHESYRFASTAPTFFEFDGKPRISRQAVQYFQDWLTKAQLSIAEDPQLMEVYQPYLTKAKRFWTERMLQANAP